MKALLIFVGRVLLAAFVICGLSYVQGAPLLPAFEFVALGVGGLALAIL